MKLIDTVRQIITEKIITSPIHKVLNDQEILKNGYPLFYHGTTDKNLIGKTGIHIGSKMAATQALQAKIGVPAKGEWDGTRKYGKTLLAGKKTLEKMNLITGYDPIINFNATEDVPDEDYYPSQREKKATYFSSKELIPINSKPIVFQVLIIGKMGNRYDNPITDSKANKIMYNNLKHGKANQGYYYTNEYEDEMSVSAVVPNSTFLKVLYKGKNEN